MGSEYIRVALTESGEGLFAFPAQRHMDPIRQRLDSKVNENPILRALRTHNNKTEGIEEWRGARWRWHWRIEGVDSSDRNMVGLHTNAIFADEMAFGQPQLYQSRAMGALPGCRYIHAGVPNNWRGSTLYRLDQTSMGSDWAHHRMDRYDNPLYDSEKEKEVAIRRSGGENTQDYITQVLGLWGDELASSFPPSAIAQKLTLPIFEADWNEDNLYFVRNAPAGSATLQQKLAQIPKVGASRYIIGLDAGYSPDPAVLLLYYEGSDGEWYELAHISLTAVAYLFQAKLIHTINQMLEWKVVGIGIEYTGPGIAVAQELMRSDIVGQFSNAFDYGLVLVNANPGGVIDVPVTSLKNDMSYIVQESLGVLSDYTPAETPQTVRQLRKVWMTEQLRLAMLRANNGFEGTKLWIGPDNRLLDSITNVGERRTSAGNIIYSKMDPSVPDHPVDALRCIIPALVHARGVETRQELDQVGGLGWVDWKQEWRAPWQPRMS
jgi:hypothetical protein